MKATSLKSLQRLRLLKQIRLLHLKLNQLQQKLQNQK